MPTDSRETITLPDSIMIPCKVELGGCGKLFRPFEIRYLCDDCSTTEKLAIAERRWLAIRRDRNAGADFDSTIAARQDFEQRCRAIVQRTPEKYRDVVPNPDLARKRLRRREAFDEAIAAIGAPMVVLVGPGGSGKSMLAAAILGTIMARALDGDAEAGTRIVGAQWLGAPHLARARQATRLGDEPEIIHLAMVATIVVIDDLGIEVADPSGALTEIVWTRSEEGKHTIVTTGRPRAQLLERYGDGVLRRLIDSNVAKVISCDESARAKEPQVA